MHHGRRCLTGGEGVCFARSGCRTTNGQGVVLARCTQLVEIALKAPVPERRYRGCESILALIPERYISADVVAMSARRWPRSLKDAPAEYITADLCAELVDNNPMNIAYVPINMMSRTLIDHALKADPWVILYLPDEKLTKKRCLDALRKDPTIPIDRFPNFIFNYLQKSADKFVNYKPIALKPPKFDLPNNLSLEQSNVSKNYDFASSDSFVKKIHYITDIHLEHQLTEHPNDICNMSVYEITSLIKTKVAELVASVLDTGDILLIGGDVADSVELERGFYKELTSYEGWQGEIITILGNHELWDGDPLGVRPPRKVDEIIDDYRAIIPRKVTLLENELLIVYKGQIQTVLDEQTILNVSVAELSEVCKNSTFLVLGGIGFSGLNPIYNARAGLYRATVSLEEDVVRSNRFRMVYEKVLASAKELPVIVMTHTQMEDWSDQHYNPQWIYLNGHTHQNSFILRDDGTSVFADNQVGYTPKSWHLNSFSIDVQKYDPFKNYPDGIHKISREQYIEFNRCQGIMMQGMKGPGNLFVLKRDGVYMFVIESASSLCLLEGGKRRKLSHSIEYYFENLSDYIRKVRHAFTPYQKALSMISKEVRLIGGVGKVHGCIVDIDWFNHVYLNPFDGKVTFYFATDMTNKLVFKNIRSLLRSSPMPPQLRDGSPMLARYSTVSKEGSVPILSCKSNKRCGLATVPEIVLDRSMYEPSRIMRSIQYVFDQNVLRVWNDEILSMDSKVELPISSTKLIPSQNAHNN